MLILGTTKRVLNCGHRTHRLAAERVMVGLLDQLGEEYGGTWYACVMFSEGHATMRGLREDTPGPSAPVREKMFGCAAKVNRDVHHDGCWIVVWHFDRMSFMWRDGDGDAAFITQIDEPWPRIKDWSIVEFCDRAEFAWQGWRELLRHADLKDEHKILRALGQRPAETRH